jgi:ribonuclease HII
MCLRAFDTVHEFPVLGMDEVGLGCIAGPVFAGGAVIPDDEGIQDVLVQMGVNDSKRLSSGARERIYEFLDSNHVYFATAQASVKEVERMGLYRALDLLYTKLHTTFARTACPKTVLIDGKERQSLKFRYEAIVRGDGKSLAIATASIVAKVERDRHMESLSEDYPEFKWGVNKGYPSQEHLRVLKELGPTEHHRMWTKPLKKIIAARAQHQEAVAEK